MFDYNFQTATKKTVIILIFFSSSQELKKKLIYFNLFYSFYILSNKKVKYLKKVKCNEKNHSEINFSMSVNKQSMYMY